MLERYLIALSDNGYPDAADAIRAEGRDVIADVLRDIADSAQHDATRADIVRATCLVYAIDSALACDGSFFAWCAARELDTSSRDAWRAYRDGMD